ncbi:MAG TPA: family 2 encapsulin nanocompartment cargo protein terpene cyclase [Trebonia sp.]|jgi:2-methylisoborneol synthase|nr:family 2 encapsulin nanocompartment cargo protein terpene cyclase [Trebonia sp.]
MTSDPVPANSVPAPLTRPPAAAAASRLLGPTGLGTSALRFQPPEAGRQPPGLAARGTAPLPYLEREWGDGSYPPLYLPATARSDEPLGAAVNERLVAWAAEVGIYADQLSKFRATGFGRLAMLTHADTDDVDMLLIAARMNAAWWAADDYYADETALGATPTELPPRLALVMSAMDPPPPAGDYTRQLEEVITADPVLVALRSATGYLTEQASPAQVMRACHTTFQMYVSWTAYAAWRYLEKLPPVWRYLAARQHDSFYTSMTLIDVVGGYELPPSLFYDKRFHRALMQAGTASVIVNDLHSVAREAADELPDSNVVLLIAAEEDIPIRAATERAVEMHNDFVRGFEESQRELAAIPSAALQRFLRGAQAWMAGGFEWHSTSDRYK